MEPFTGASDGVSNKTAMQDEFLVIIMMMKMDKMSKNRIYLLEAQHDLQRKQRLDDNKSNVYMYLNLQGNKLRPSTRSALWKLQIEIYRYHDSDTSEADEMKAAIGDLNKQVAASKEET